MKFTTREQVYEEFPFLLKLDNGDLMMLVTSFMMSVIKKAQEGTVIDAVKFLMESSN